MIVLASKSASRRTMLAAAGVEFEVRPAAIDERALEARLAAAGVTLSEETVTPLAVGISALPRS